MGAAFSGRAWMCGDPWGIGGIVRFWFDVFGAGRRVLKKILDTFFAGAPALG